jgi:hypothetical protein
LPFRFWAAFAAETSATQSGATCRVSRYFLATVILFYPRFVVGDPIAYDASTGLLRSYGGLYLSGTFINARAFRSWAAGCSSTIPF